MVTYLSAEHAMEHPDLGKYKTYAIIAVYDDTVVSGVLDVSLEASEAKTMADKLNTYEVSLLHFKDVVQDMVEDLMRA